MISNPPLTPFRLKPVDTRLNRPRLATASPRDRSTQSNNAQTANALQVLGEPLIMSAGNVSIGDLIYERLRTAIIDAKILPGASISETELADYLQVSRTPVRAALQRLNAQGLVQVAPQRGTTVARLDLARIQEALFMREAVECTALQRIRLPLPEIEIQRLQAIVQLHTQAAERGDSASVLENDDDFHRKLLELAGVPGAWSYVLEAREVHRRVRILGHTEFQTALPAAQQHDQVVAALASGRLAKATELMRAHIRGNARFSDEMSSHHPEYFSSRSSTE